MLEIPDISSDYWESPSPSDRGETGSEVLYTAIGEFLSAYESIENTLAQLFLIFIGNDFWASLDVIKSYGTHTSVHKRISDINLASRLYSSTRNIETEPLELLLRHVKKAAEVRAVIAHGQVMQISIGPDNTSWFFTPTWYNSKHQERFDKEWWSNLPTLSEKDPFAVFGFKFRYTASDINHYRSLILHIRTQLGFYLSYLLKEDVLTRTRATTGSIAPYDEELLKYR